MSKTDLHKHFSVNKLFNLILNPEAFSVAKWSDLIL